MISAGKLLYRVWHRPRAALRDLIREGGPVQRRRTRQGAVAMEEAASLLTPPSAKTGSALEVHLLTGNRFWHQSAFCLISLAHTTNHTIQPTFYDDGSLQPDQAYQLQRLFPAATFISQQETRKCLDELLPKTHYPALRERWEHYPNLRKLTDIHLGRSGWKLVIDSDLLFFRQPTVLLEWLNHPTQPLHAVDCTESYGYTRHLMESLTGSPLATRLNVGLCGLNSGDISWPQLEFWTAELIAREKTNYFLEQALVAMMLAGKSCTILPENDYITFPQIPEVIQCQAVVHHYVDVSKRWYFQKNWRKFSSPPTTT
ncbi:MAG: glycosyl transferase [Blastochloris sp.]|nr:glycosyl transferase [Blastochloris sp.]